MNIFLDSDILHEDYFFQNKTSKTILDYARKGLVKLYMSDVVRQELRWHFQKDVIIKQNELIKISKNFRKLKIDIKFEPSEINIDNQMNKFDDFYQCLLEDGSLIILEAKNDYLPDIINKAVFRKKPFSENKTELKDAIIWLTYSDIVENENLSNCILLTKNTTDFCSKDDKSKVHSDLAADTERFIVFNDPFALLKEYSPTIESPANKIQAYIDTLDIDNIFVYDILSKQFIKEIEKKVHDLLENISVNDVLKDEYWHDGYIAGNEVEILDCEDVEFEVLTERALISGLAFVACDSEIYQYNALRDSGEDQYTLLEEKTLIFEVYFNFDLMVDGDCSEFEITQINLNSIE